ncbi:MULTISPECIES: HAD-IA family hydrolase [unclassified Ruegeria]|uniref:HAD-IA family hydrolase n=1 Tax=unclassified Ruegeria TaxID=2625375 RepID=UPI001488654D|nr:MULTISPECIES: HAD-IA family hydrolase [unclassified Ruegeria]NOD75590.1 HAD-IA family hydrolase [Ruegeria sp. HKCCD4332]NOD91011.1 HAD-IA family hydrolase [Ruegeria sp. HKCCD4318]NOE16389.1 HAD-IA family hydrolase [Ruegeria sp. HKCCD4318-2]NOG10180.1 HAD-IA family hydrolase [Ruegeria sp. HKCCD4315]
MSAPLRLVLFDVDGTLVDSQGSIVHSMATSFQAASVPVPSRDAILSIVGLSLPHAIARLAPDQPSLVQSDLVEGYKEAYHAHRLDLGAASSPLYPGAREAIEALHAVPEVLLGVATGKSQRGLDALIEAHGLEAYFVTRQVADHHPSKPHPSMVQTALSETGVDPDCAVMIGDTSFDMDMAAAAGVRGIGVTWGYHDRSALASATCVIETFDQLPTALAGIWN